MRRFKPVSEQVLVITGASSGIGLATAKLAAKKGAKVVLSSRNGQELRRIAAELRSQGADVLAVEADVSRPGDLLRVKAEAIGRYGRVDTWVNNAGLSIFGNLLDVPYDDERRLFDINFWGVRHGCHAAVEAMKNSGGGVIINLGSEVSGRSIPVQGIYAASKHAVKAYTDSLRMDLEKQGANIFVSLVRPTAINTPFAEHAKNYLREGEPSLPSPTYHPDVVARAILECAEHPQRDVYVGASARLFDVLDTFFPRMLDKLMEGMMYKEQSKGTKEPHTEAQEALDHPPAREGRVLGNNRGLMHRTSLYTSATQRPLRSLLVVAGMMAAGVVFASKRAEAPGVERGQEAA